jgi:hypothetical protein
MYRKFWAIARLTPKRLALVAMVVVAVAVPLAQAQAAHSAKAGPCRSGDAPLPHSASTSKTSAAGLTARGWDSWSAGAARGCQS